MYPVIFICFVVVCLQHWDIVLGVCVILCKFLFQFRSGVAKFLVLSASVNVQYGAISVP